MVINLTKNVKYMYIENHKAILGEIREDLNN